MAWVLKTADNLISQVKVTAMLARFREFSQAAPILMRGDPRIARMTMVERRIKPYGEQVAEEERREAQRHAFRRNQVFGLLIVAAAIVSWWLFHTNPKWIFPAGWWRT